METKYGMIPQTMKCKLGGLLLVLIIGSGWGGAQTLQFPTTDLRQNILQVADHHVQQREWAQAIMQYYAFLYLFPQDTLTTSINFKIARIYELIGEPDLALQHLRQYVDHLAPQSPCYLEARMRLAYQLYKTGRLGECIKYAWEQPEVPFRVITLYALVELEAFAETDSLVRSWAAQIPAEFDVVAELRQVGAVPYRLPWQQKWSAVALSAVLPGSGQIYLQEHLNGGLTLIGFGGLMAVTFYVAQQLPHYLFFTGSVTLIYYLANLYATYRCTEEYQARQVAQRYQMVLARYPLQQVLGLPEIVVGQGSIGQ